MLARRLKFWFCGFLYCHLPLGVAGLVVVLVHQFECTMISGWVVGQSSYILAQVRSASWAVFCSPSPGQPFFNLVRRVRSSLLHLADAQGGCSPSSGNPPGGPRTTSCSSAWSS